MPLKNSHYFIKTNFGKLIASTNQTQAETERIIRENTMDQLASDKDQVSYFYTFLLKLFRINFILDFF